METLQTYITNLLADIEKLDSELVLFILLAIITLLVLDQISIYIKRLKVKSGLEISKDKQVWIDGAKTMPTKEYVSDIQGLAGRPDALISENGFLVPVERKPLAKKMRDRYVAQLLVYMRLIEEFEGKRPPYGYLLLGRQAKRYRIYNTPERQAWLQEFIDQMLAILDGQQAVPAPHPRKCRKCSVNSACTFANFGNSELQTK